MKALNSGQNPAVGTRHKTPTGRGEGRVVEEEEEERQFEDWKQDRDSGT